MLREQPRTLASWCGTYPRSQSNGFEYRFRLPAYSQQSAEKPKACADVDHDNSLFEHCDIGRELHERHGHFALRGMFADCAFRDVGVIGELLTTGLPRYDRLDHCGVYALILPPECEVSFLDADRSREAGNVISPWEVDRLRRKWVYGTRVAYIGLAGDRSPRSLRNRLRDLLNHCAGKTSGNGPHKGGEIIWQLAAYDSLLLRAMCTGSPPEPRDTERQLLAAFAKLHGALPFANRKA